MSSPVSERFLAPNGEIYALHKDLLALRRQEPALAAQCREQLDAATLSATPGSASGNIPVYGTDRPTLFAGGKGSTSLIRAVLEHIARKRAKRMDLASVMCFRSNRFGSEIHVNGRDDEQREEARDRHAELVARGGLYARLASLQFDEARALAS